MVERQLSEEVMSDGNEANGVADGLAAVLV